MVEPLERVAQALGRLPTIGRKSAWRLALFLAERPETEVQELAQSIARLPRELKVCSQCHSYALQEVCSICSSSKRDSASICVVAKVTDLFSIEKSGRYHGLYHVLGGVLSPINGITPQKLTIAHLVERVSSDSITEVIIGLGGSTDAETTALYLARTLAAANPDIKVSRFARGMPAGIDLEYVDDLTLSQALAERTDITYHP
jgi:recombination protein RecR